MHTQKHSSHPKYRPDIDGLRAIAVAAVVAFHGFPKLVQGGFIGVDVFFVISGYLISSILFENLDKETFSFYEFYNRRIRRIFPALVLTLTASGVYGWFALLPDEYKQLGKYIASSASFATNFALWNDSGYFDNYAETKPLLHLWSLAVEEQFYVVWPLMVWAVWKLGLSRLFLVGVIVVSSFTLSMIEVNQDVIADFYSPITRFWELLIGALLAYFISNEKEASYIWLNKTSVHVRSITSLIGLSLLVYGFLKINHADNFPGALALVPVLGASLIVFSGQDALPNRAVLSNKILVWLGLISYPLYLYHWPVLSFSRIINGETPSVSTRILGILASVLLAWFTYKFIEKPIRSCKCKKKCFATLLFLMVLLGIAGYAAYQGKSPAFREPSFESNASTQTNLLSTPSVELAHQNHTNLESMREPLEKSMVRSARQSECFEIPFAYRKTENWYCTLGNTNSEAKFFAFGDSHGLSLIPALEKFANATSTKIYFTGTSGCPPVLGIQSMRGAQDIEKNNCKELNERVFNYVKENHIPNVILIARWRYYTGSMSRNEQNVIARDPSSTVTSQSSTIDFYWGINNTVKQYKSIGTRVFIVQDNPQQLHEPRDILRKSTPTDDAINEYSVTTKEHKANQNDINRAIIQSGAISINFDEILCNEKICPLAKNSRFLYFDDDHLSITGALLVYPSLERALSN